jgi:large repetitive protein
MNFTGSLGCIDTLLRKVAVLAGSLVLCASIPQLAAQTPRFVSGSAQPEPGTTTGTYSFTSVASDRSGNLYVVEFDLGTVQKLPAGGSQLEPVDATGVTRATAIAVDKGGDLFIANDSATAGGQPTSTIILLTPGGAQSTLGSGWITPKGVAADDLGNVYVLDGGPNSTAPAVYEIPNGTNTQVQLPIYGLGDPEGLAVDPAGNVFVMDHSSGNLYELPAGASSPLTIVAGLSNAWGVAADIAGNVFYANGSSIDEIPAGSTTPIRAWQTAGGVNVASYGNIAVDGNGTLYFDAQAGSSYFIGAVQRTSIDFGTPEICVPGWNSPSTCTSMQTVWLASPSANLPTVQLMAGGVPSTDFSGTSGGCSASSASVVYICAFNVTYAPKHSGVSSTALQVLDASGNIASKTLLYGVGTGPQVVYGPEAQSTALNLSGLQEVAVDAAGNIFVTEPSGGQVLKFPMTGAGIPIGTGFGYPFGLAVTPAGEVFVADALYNQLVKIALDGSKTVISQNLTTPKGVALDKYGNVYVADQDDNRIVKISSIGNHQSTVSGGGWSYPIAVAVDGQGNIYAADGPSNGGTRKVTMLNASTGAVTTLSSSFSSPCGLAVDAAGDVYVAATRRPPLASRRPR